MGLDGDRAADMVDKLAAIPRDTTPDDAWREMTRSVLSPDIPYSVHNHLFKLTFSDWDPVLGPPPAWRPTAAEVDGSNIAEFARKIGLDSIGDLHRWSVDNRETFWEQIIEALGICFKHPPRSIVDLADGIESAVWLPGSRLNIAESCFGAPRNTPAIVYQSEEDRIETITYGELDRLSNRVANSLCAMGLSRGLSVAIAMPMTAEAVAAYLGVVKAGCVVASIADSFAPEEIATRLRIANVQVVITQDVILRAGKTLPLYKKVIDAGARRVIVVPAAGGLSVALRNCDSTWCDFLVTNDAFEAVACDPDDMTNILFSSGTTGDPKAVPWTQTTPVKCAMDGFLHHDIHPGEVVAWPTNIGWMMGPWLIYASLVNRATMALYYGSPVTRGFCEFVQNAAVQMLGVVPSMVKMWQNTDAVQGLDWTAIKVFSSTGECSNVDDYLYLMSLAGYRPVIEYCGGTEIGGGYISGTILQPASPSAFSAPCFGMDFCILDEDGKPTNNGELFIVPPSIGLSNTLLNGDHHAIYYANTPRGPRGELLRRHGDQIEELPGGYYRGHGRADDTMNIGGIKVSSTEIERTLASIDGVLETAAIAVDPPEGGPSRLVVYAVLESNTDREAGSLKGDMQRAIAKELNPLFKIHAVVIIDTLPRTASNKIMRRVLRERYGDSR